MDALDKITKDALAKLRRNNPTYISLRAALAQAFREREENDAATKALTERGPKGYSDPEYSAEGLARHREMMRINDDVNAIKRVVALVWVDESPQEVVDQIEKDAQVMVEETRD